MADDGMRITIKLDGREHLFRYNDLTAMDVRDCRKETGFTVNRLLGVLGDADVDIDSLAAIVWLARRQEGERSLRYDAVASTLHPNSDVILDVHIPSVLDEENDELNAERPPPE